MFRIFLSILFFVIATGLLIYVHSWLGLAVAVLFYTKGTLSLLFSRKKNGTVPQAVLSALNGRLVAMGYFLSAALFLISGIMGEGWLGFLVTPVFASVGLVFLFISKHGQTKPSDGPQLLS